VGELRGLSSSQLRARLRQSEKSVGVLLRLRGFTVATGEIIKRGRSTASYHLVVLNVKERRLTIKSFPLSEQEAANRAYAECEDRAKSGEHIDPVLVMGGTVETLRKSFPNYFLDTNAFVSFVTNILAE
jgi:hypothetical protein